MAKKNNNIKEDSEVNPEFERIPVDRIDYFSHIGICSKCMRKPLMTQHRELANKVGMNQAPSLIEKQRIDSEAWKQLIDLYGVPCVQLGPDEGAFYSESYCATCCREMADLLDQITTEEDDDG